ncbi:hypothetical protein HXX76_009257 [Chlamydomonas incerta]|uniref:BACK domain-containing protein n=1 Tax=Chlamydomonas incerta TaxID=51695 RepID=A0A835STW1_CHLIN|nr:hypothetical protein HXX76_009257 [Chlamydomonas incerta]|eukprot:KAG2431761.1 hypothetical protein HXX76_009257 [Chlamydomonas incerta]
MAAKRWSQQEEPAPGGGRAGGKRKRVDDAADESPADGSAGAAAPTPAAAVSAAAALTAGDGSLGGGIAATALLPVPAGAASGLPRREVLRVVLDAPSDLPFALNAIRFLYSGDLNHVQSVAPAESASARAAGGLAGSGVDTSGADPGAAALSYRLHKACLEELVDWAKQDAAAAVIQAENQAQHQSALHALTDRAARALVLRLPAAALEAALLAENFATDDESTVLLLLATWLAANSVAAPVQLALQRLLRLGHMNEAYLRGYLPLLVPWLPLTRQERVLLAQCSRASDAKRRRINNDCQDLPRTRDGVRWFQLNPRPQPPPRVLEWVIPGARLADPLAKFAKSESRFIAKGFEWSARADLGRERVNSNEAQGPGRTLPALYLMCDLPRILASLGAEIAECEPLASPGDLELVLLGGPAGADAVYISKYGSDSRLVECGCGWGASLPPPQPQPQQPQQPQQQPQEPAPQQQQGENLAAAWSAYMRDGQVWGQLRWRP